MKQHSYGCSQFIIFLIFTLTSLVLVIFLSLRIGALSISYSDMWNALFHYSGDSYKQLVVRTLRFPRTVIGLAVGAALAVSGASLQAITRNPLAGPSILGINNGAAFAIVCAVYFFHLSDPRLYLWLAFLGGITAAVMVFAIGAISGKGSSPARLALAGVIISTLLSSWMTAMLLLDRQTLDIVRFWLAGSLSGRDMEIFLKVLPFLVIGVSGNLILGNQLNILSLGDDTAKGLGMRTNLIRFSVIVFVVLSAGASVAAAGPIGFIGLAVPHIVRSFSGHDYRRILIFSLILGPVFLLGADILGRILLNPTELQVGIVTAFTGAPFIIGLARKGRIGSV